MTADTVAAIFTLAFVGLVVAAATLAIGHWERRNERRPRRAWPMDGTGRHTSACRSVIDAQATVPYQIAFLQAPTSTTTGTLRAGR